MREPTEARVERYGTTKIPDSTQHTCQKLGPAIMLDVAYPICMWREREHKLARQMVRLAQVSDLDANEVERCFPKSIYLYVLDLD